MKTGTTHSAMRIYVALCVTAISIPMNALAGTFLPCRIDPREAAVHLFEFIEDPSLELDSDGAYRQVFSRQLLQYSSKLALNSVIKQARSTYLGAGSETPLSRRLVTQPSLVQSDEPSFNPRGGATVRLLSLTSRGKIEQRMAVTCEEDSWKILSLSYGPTDSQIRNQK